MEKIDVVIPLGNRSEWNDNEIRYCLRSLEKYFVDLGNVYIVGFLPSFIQRVIHIPAEDVFKVNKDANLIRKVLLACRNEQLSQEFIRMSDDQLLLKSCDKEDFYPKYSGDLRDLNWKFLNRWRNRLKRTFEILLLQNKSSYHYDSHIPALYNKELFEKVMLNYEWGVEKAGFTINSLYFNNIDIERKRMTGNFKANFERLFTDVDEINQELNGKTVAGYNDKGLTPELKVIIEKLFPEKSSFEK